MSYVDYNSTGLAAWDATEDTFWPYTCSDTYTGVGTTTFEDAYHAAFDDPITGFYITSFHYDLSYGDYSRLYWLEVWVR